jgi:putative hydrolase of the HAD superfamily
VTAEATRAARVGAVTVDAYMTLVRLVDPVPALVRALRERGVEAGDAAVEAAFAAEVRHYGPRSHTGRDPETLRNLQRECAAVFLAALDAPLDPDEFAPALVGALHFEALPGTQDTLAGLRARGIRLAVVSNWDASLPLHLERAGFNGCFDAIVTAADAGVRKPDPAIFRVALDRLGMRPDDAVHVGDAEVDAKGAHAAGMRYAPPPLADAVAAIARQS